MNDGKYLESVVQIIEKSINPTASIRHDVQMPVLNSPSGRTRQCDIVITSGKKPRETVSIIEVQDRNSKVDINDFNGWLVKLEEVGAQHLICVSKHEFPKSIQEVSAQHGHKVRLVQLSDLPHSKIPLDVFFNDLNISLFEILGIGSFEINLYDDDAETELLSALLVDGKCNVNFKFLFFEDYGSISLYEYCREHDLVKANAIGEGCITIDKNSDPNIKFIINDKVLSGEIKFEINWESELIKVPINILTYNQNGDALAWLAEAKYEVPQGPVGFKFGITPNDDGYNIVILNSSLTMPPDSMLTIRAE